MLSSPSTDKAAARAMPKLSSVPIPGFQASTTSIYEGGKASLSQSPFHQAIVTRSPNHMWAFRATTSATRPLLGVGGGSLVEE